MKYYYILNMVESVNISAIEILSSDWQELMKLLKLRQNPENSLQENPI